MSVLSTADVVRLFGDPTPYVLADGTISPIWEPRILEDVLLPDPIKLNGHPSALVRKIRCHHKVAPFLRAGFLQVWDERLWASLKDFGGCYCWRTQRLAPTSRSRHSWGIAFDLNVADNPFRLAPNMPPRIVEIFKGQGFSWGGDFKVRKDGMHFEFSDASRVP
jgi:hypothetical protein